MIRLIKVAGREVPVKVISEWRNNTRISLGKNYVILRIPKNIWGDNVQNHLSWAGQWLHNIYLKKPDALRRYAALKTYQDGSQIVIGNETFTLSVTEISGDMAKIKKTAGNILHISIPNGKDMDRQKVIKKLLVKFFCKYFLPVLIQKVKVLNQQHFNQSYQDIRLKYNTSNWGSCSHGRNLNFSVRLFLAPPQVFDYVIIHELAHLTEMNHSKKFWKIVEDAMPDYKKWEELLKINSHIYDF